MFDCGRKKVWKKKKFLFVIRTFLFQDLFPSKTIKTLLARLKPFPSPFGVMDSEQFSKDRSIGVAPIVSVPLRGNGLKVYTQFETAPDDVKAVFVPLRGNGI